eukprot:gene11366-biopygen8093
MRKGTHKLSGMLGCKGGESAEGLALLFACGTYCGSAAPPAAAGCAAEGGDARFDPFASGGGASACVGGVAFGAGRAAFAAARAAFSALSMDVPHYDGSTSSGEAHSVPGGPHSGRLQNCTIYMTGMYLSLHLPATGCQRCRNGLG